jgi:hypothetical protein
MVMNEPPPRRRGRRIARLSSLSARVRRSQRQHEELPVTERALICAAKFVVLSPSSTRERAYLFLRAVSRERCSFSFSFQHPGGGS